MFKKKFTGCPLTEDVPKVSVTRVVPKGSDGETILLRADSNYFKDFPRGLDSSNFSVQAMLDSGISLKEVNSKVFVSDSLSDEEMKKLKEVLDKKEED